MTPRTRPPRPAPPRALFEPLLPTRRAAAAAARAANRGTLRLFLDTASTLQWDAWAGSGLFYGYTTNPSILLRDGVRGCDVKTAAALWSAAQAVGAQELQVQAWGATSAKLIATGMALAGVDDRIVVKVPATRPGLEAAAKLKDAGVRVTLTAVYQPAQAVVGAAIGVDYIAPYLGRITDSGRDGIAEVAAMQATLENVDSRTRLLVASVRTAADVVALTNVGVNTFTLSPAAAQALVASADTDDAAAAFEDAAAQLGAE
jgi:transaldolase